MTNTTQQTRTTQVYRVYIKATPEAIWEAITTPEWTAKYGYRGPSEFDLRPGGAFCTRGTPEMVAMGLPEVVVDGEVLESDPPHHLVHTYRFHFAPEQVAEGFSTVTYDLGVEGDLTCLTVTHDVTDKPIMAAMLPGGDGRLAEGGGGWPWILSDLKSLLETGRSLQG